MTAIRMLEAVLDNDDELTTKRLKSGKEVDDSQATSDLDTDEEAHIRKSKFSTPDFY